MAEEKRDAEPVVEQNQPQGFIEALSSIDASVTNLVGLLPALVTIALKPPPSDGEMIICGAFVNPVNELS